MSTPSKRRVERSRVGTAPAIGHKAPAVPDSALVFAWPVVTEMGCRSAWVGLRALGDTAVLAHARTSLSRASPLEAADGGAVTDGAHEVSLGFGVARGNGRLMRLVLPHFWQRVTSMPVSSNSSSRQVGCSMTGWGMDGVGGVAFGAALASRSRRAVTNLVLTLAGANSP